MTRHPIRSFRLRPPTLHEILHILAFAGVLLVLLGAMLSLQVLVHAFAHTSYEPTLLAQIMGDFSPVPMLLAILIAITAAEVLFVASWADPSGGPNASVGRWSLASALCLAFLATFTAALWISDIRHVEYELCYGENPFLLTAQTSFILYSLGAVAFFVLWRIRRPMFAVLAFVLPVPFLARLIASPVARSSLRSWGPQLSPLFPRILPALLVAGCLVGICLLLLYLRTRLFASNLPRQCVVATVAVLVYAQFSLTSFALVQSFHCLCMTTGYQRAQWTAAALIALSFVLAWAAVVIIGYLRRRQRQRCRGKESARQAPDAEP
ncbi:MAG: hypothetical protein JW889_12455 [Verrucomicrobia bacterium]|nr:hypothetical protein [Verrucomicrobiota bacterium]